MTGESPGRGKAGGQPRESRVLTGGGHWIFIPNCAQDSPLPDTHSLTLIPLGLHGRVEALGQNLPELVASPSPGPLAHPIAQFGLGSQRCGGQLDTQSGQHRPEIPGHHWTLAAILQLGSVRLGGSWTGGGEGHASPVCLGVALARGHFASATLSFHLQSPDQLLPHPRAFALAPPPQVSTQLPFTHSSCSFMSPDLPG